MGKLEEIEHSLDQGKLKQTKKLIGDFIKSKALTPAERIRLSEVYRLLGSLDKGIKVLGPEQSYNDLLTLDIEQLALQIRLAYMVHFIGARYASKRLFTNLEKIAKEKGLEFSSIDPRYYRYLSGFYLASWDFENAYKCSLKAIDLLGQHPTDLRIAKINKAAACWGLNNFEEYLGQFQELMDEAGEDNKLWHGVYHYRIGSGHLETKNFEKAKEHFDKSDALLKDSKTKDYYYLLRSKAVYFLITEKFDEAKKAVTEALTFMKENGLPNSFQMEMMYWAEKIPGINVTVSQKVASRAHLSFHPVSYVLGKQYPTENPIPISFIYGEEYEQNDNDCWLIKDGEILAVKYDSIIQNFNNTNKVSYDFYSGIILNRQREGSVEVLSSLQSMCLAAVIGCGAIGANKWLLIDFLYRQDFFQPNNGEERIKSLMKSLKKSQFEISRKKNSYYMEPPEGIILIPMNHSPKGAHCFYRSRFQTFTRKELEAFFEIKPTTAKTWISNWLEEGLIASEGRGKSTTYNFKD